MSDLSIVKRAESTDNVTESENKFKLFKKVLIILILIHMIIVFAVIVRPGGKRTESEKAMEDVFKENNSNNKTRLKSKKAPLTNSLVHYPSNDKTLNNRKKPVKVSPALTKTYSRTSIDSTILSMRDKLTTSISVSIFSSSIENKSLSKILSKIKQLKASSLSNNLFKTTSFTTETSLAIFSTTITSYSTSSMISTSSTSTTVSFLSTNKLTFSTLISTST